MPKSRILVIDDEAAIRDLLSSSIDYYALALARNKPMADNTLRLISDQPSVVSGPKGRSTVHGSLSTVVLVAGGFHTAAIA